MVSFVRILFKDHPEDRLIVLPAIMIAELLQGEYCINVIDGINNHKISRMLIP